MDENPVSAEVEQTADQQDAFLEGWGEPEPGEDADQQAETEESETEPETDGEDSSGSEAEQSADAAETDTAKAQAAQEQAWNVKVLDQQRTIRASEITPELLQKGLDYDRIRGKYDEVKPVIELMSSYAKQAGMGLPDYVNKIRQEAKKAGGMSEAEAKRAVELEDREAVVAAKEAQQQAGDRQRQADRDRMQRDLNDFGAAFPEAYKLAKSNPDSIPKSVWDDVNAGMTLTAAWAKYTVAQANASAAEANRRADTSALNSKNAARSTGSMKSAGSDAKTTDAFLVGWGS